MKVYRNIKPDFKDPRGLILRPMDDIVKEKIKSVSLITSNDDAVRGNHYHKKEAHFMYVVTGEAEFFEKKADDPKAKVKKTLLKEGDMVYTAVGYTHAVRCLKPSIMLYFSTLHRTKKGDYGDTFKEVIMR